MFSQRPSATWRGTFATIPRSMEERVGLINDRVARNDGEKERKRREERGEERREVDATTKARKTRRKKPCGSRWNSSCLRPLSRSKKWNTR